jgi:hypothetical protein
MKSAIRLQTVNFTGTTKFAADGTAYIDAQPQAQQYVGEPSKQIDHNWNQLTKSKWAVKIICCTREANIM